jgi:DnaJ-class molecular chaperone
MKIHRQVEGRDEEKILFVDLQPWWKSGTKVTFEGEGDKASGQRAQDIQFVIRVLPHSTFEREEEHLICNRKIALRDALSGYEMRIRGLDGEEHKRRIEEVIEPGREYRIPGSGMFRKDGTRGDIIVRFHITFPSRLSSDAQAQVRRILPVN